MVLRFRIRDLESPKTKPKTAPKSICTESVACPMHASGRHGPQFLDRASPSYSQVVVYVAVEKVARILDNTSSQYSPP